ncbi:hypothetical protein LPMP_150430 [Leishmania panamensis]|uniref:Uncharacterized protein n=1 Tax=Leishmania panamensis TaxID=5679 RepID=A0A088S5I8_LEIPA|nr:hypothetical protein LPMP_150430 [Leishmania panamensis]AIN96766.1 hypothetical protein LPMP_150430 [Leishmania panamensis]
MRHEFRSLFLPLAAEERAVFVDFFPLLLDSLTSIQSAAAAAAGEHPSRSTAATAPEITSSAGEASPCCFAEAGKHLQGVRGLATDLQNQCGVPLRSLVFAVGSARADAVIVVLRRGHVVLYGLDQVHTPPYEKYRMRPLPTTQQLMAARETARSSGNIAVSDSAGNGGAEATCAALLPLHIAYCCRIPLSASFSSATVPADGTHRSGSREKDEDFVYLRGIVGNSDGRVSLFSDTSYTMSFAAHETPVARVDAVLLPPCTLDEDASMNPGPTTSTHRASSTGAGANTNAAASGEPMFSTSLQRQERLTRATQRLGLVTSGSDGVVFLWRRLGDSMSPIVIVRPSLFSRHVAYAVHHPSALSVLLSARASLSPPEAAIDAELSCPPSCLLHAAASVSRTLRVRQLASLAPKATRTTLSSTARRESVEEVAPTSMSVTLPGSWPATVTAIATHHSVTLVAMGASLFSLVHMDARSSTCVWKSDDIITQLILRDSVALAVCARSGAVHVLTIHPTTGKAVHQRAYNSYKSRVIHHTSLHAASLLMSIVDVCGSAEIVQLPADVLMPSEVRPLGDDYTGDNAAHVNLLASMAALRAKVCIEDIQSGSHGGASESGAANRLEMTGSTSFMHEASTAFDQLNERLLLARYAVPEECDQFMAANAHVF